MKNAFTNELIHETSPYLLQHAHNPVHWRAWSESSLAKAKELDRPILVSIGYSACHWCHVMERESFENAEVAAYMNEHFINIKVDREERPDLDHIYMDAVQAIAGNGGWPLNVFLTTDAKPFYGGTYYPPQKAFNRSSWKEVLIFINNSWKKRRQEIEEQAETLLQHINSSSNFIAKNSTETDATDVDSLRVEQCRMISGNMLKSADTVYGGFGNAPKFPQTFTIQYLLNYGYHFNDESALQHATFSLQKMLAGGIYDHLAGGLARYSTDAAWLAPHFEKMLYDNALLVSVLCDAFQISGDVIFKNAIEQTLDFFINNMQNPDGGFYAALDADSEGVEGKFYVWDKAEIDNILGTESAVFCDWYGIMPEGNWEGKNILHITQKAAVFAGQHAMSVHELESFISSAEQKLLAVRNKRISPATDDKILLGWNALLLTAFCKSSAALGNDKYKNQAIILFNFLVEKFSQDGEIAYHSYKNGVAKHPAYLDDYACLIQACIFLQQLIPGEKYLLYANSLAKYVTDHFQNEESGFFYYTNKNQTDIILRKVEIYDGALPSGNSLMAENLLYLAVVFDNHDWWLNANKMLKRISDILFKHPTSFGIWANIFINQTRGTHEVVVTGQNVKKLLDEILGMYLPGKVLLSDKKENNLSLLKNKLFGDNPLIYVCKNYTCKAPVGGISAFKKLLQAH